ncbi:YraN family protein [Corynebacterium mastitidis]|uniref:YraN family protein n=1 Tax=Corynebacterium mastitidis TaxID=161890 RepID=UPI000477B330|nr:YraN family protein [Corynebacterium mastitidis]
MTQGTMTSGMELGRQGEAFAAAYYRDRGARLVGMNARCGRDEIDLIVREPTGTLVFVEVKTRSGRGCGAAEAVDARKVARMRRAAARWLRGRPYSPVRLDVLALTVVGRERREGREHVLFDVERYEGVDQGAC